MITSEPRAHKRKLRITTRASAVVLALGLMASVSGVRVWADNPQTEGQQPDTKIDIPAGDPAPFESSGLDSNAIAAEEAKKVLQEKAVEHLYLAHKYALRFDFDLAEVEMKEAISFLPELRVIHRDYCLLAVAKGNLSIALAEFMLATGIGDPIPYTEQEGKLLNLK